MRGLRKLYNFGNEPLLITDLSKKEKVLNFLQKNRNYTPASRRERLRKILNEHGDDFKNLVDNYNAQNPPTQQHIRQAREENLYGAQVQRARRLPQPARRRPSIIINGENYTAKQALNRFSQLRGFLQGRKQILEKSLHAKVRTWFKKSKVTNDMLALEPEIVPREARRLLGKNVINHYTINSIGNTSPRDFLNYVKNTVLKFLDENRQNKVRISLITAMMRADPATGIVTNEEEVPFNSLQESIFASTDLENTFEKMTTKILESFATYLKNGSGWFLKNVVRLDITLSKLNPLKGSSQIPLPDWILKKKALINMENEDDECFKWSVTRALNLVGKHSQRVTKQLREQSEKLNWNGIEFPTPCSERMFKKFENNNDVSVLVFGYDEKNMIPLYVPVERRERIVRLLFYKNEDGTKSHYCVIRSMSRLVSSQINKKKAKKSICDFCLNSLETKTY